MTVCGCILLRLVERWSELRLGVGVSWEFKWLESSEDRSKGPNAWNSGKCSWFSAPLLIKDWIFGTRRGCDAVKIATTLVTICKKLLYSAFFCHSRSFNQTYNVNDLKYLYHQ
ncbi:hypothetical protein OPV22_019504 [Ensete ventricosum]|uniref:Amidase domain-containing protein n=1 Tax=Ensete ventricosum TaxID=4639 RepID=A0AAV8QL64_ENSVE|nr:hypothetical protein OPV22_019504 [Ensete ventricosum]